MTIQRDVYNAYLLEGKVKSLVINILLLQIISYLLEEKILSLAI